MIKQFLISLIAGIMILFIPFVINFYKKWRYNWYCYVALKLYCKQSYKPFFYYCINSFLYKDGDGKLKNK